MFPDPGSAWLTTEQLLKILLGLASTAFIIAGLTFVAHNFLVRRDAQARRVESIRGRPSLVRDHALKLARRGITRLSTIRARDDRVMHLLGRLLEKLGIPAERAATLLVAFRAALAATLGLGTMVLFQGAATTGFSQRSVFAGVAIALAGWMAPWLLARWLADRHFRAVVAGLPEALELLVIAVEAGLALEDGIDRIVAELRHSQPALADELAITCADLKILPSRDVGLANFAKRIDAPSVRSLVTTLSQTMRYGTPLAQALRVVSAELRNETLIRLEERANRLPVLLTIPMLLLIFPSIFLIVGGPAVLRILDIWHR
jgi:tight adherence protein C